MKVEVITTQHVRPQGRIIGEQVILLPTIDAWYAYVRTAVPLLFFATTPSLCELYDSLGRNLDRFPFFAGHLEPCTSQDEKKRVRLVWGSSTDLGSEVIEAQTTAHLRSLLPPCDQDDAPKTSFLWDRSSASPTGLFPRTPTNSLVRVQITKFGCGGCTVGFDFDHALADAHTIGMFFHSWSTIYNQRYSGGKNGARMTVPDLPPVASYPSYLEDLISTSSYTHEVLIDKASQLPTRRPDFRAVKKMETPDSANVAAPPSAFSLVGKTSYMLQIAPTRYEQMIRSVKDEASLPVTEQAALAGLLWAALNRARLSAGMDPIGLHFVLSLREPLGLSNSQVGSPALAIMVPGEASDGDREAHTDSAKLASQYTSMLDTYDQDALRAVAYDATCRDSPTDGRRARPSGEVMTFTSGVQCDLSQMSFGSHRPVFLAPWALPLDNFFAVMGGISQQSDNSSKRWYQHGVTIFFRLPTEVAEELASDRAFRDFEHHSYM